MLDLIKKNTTDLLAIKRFSPTTYNTVANSILGVLSHDFDSILNFVLYNVINYTHNAGLITVIVMPKFMSY